MCNHEWVAINDVKVCKRCGLTRTHDGKILFDRRFANVGKMKKRRKNNVKTGK